MMMGWSIGLSTTYYLHDDYIAKVNAKSSLIRLQITHWVELFFGVKLIMMNCHQLLIKGETRDPLWDIECITEV